MIVDFHVHTNGSHDCGMDPAHILEVARSAGLDGIAVCDHGTVAVALEMAAAVAHASAHAQPRVIVGEEIRTSEGEIIGYFLRETIPSGLSPERTIELINEQGGVVCVPHPFDRFRHSPLTRLALERIVGRVDVIEALNARNLAHADDALACGWASARCLPTIGGSDAHTYREIGRARTELPLFDSPASFLAALPHARLLGGHSSPLVHVATALRKRLRSR